MFVVRITGAFVVVVLAAKMALFVADDSKFLEIESMAALERRIGQLIDEAIRHRQEKIEREEDAVDLALSNAFNAVRRSVIRRVRSIARAARAAWACALVLDRGSNTSTPTNRRRHLCEDRRWHQPFAHGYAITA